MDDTNIDMNNDMNNDLEGDLDGGEGGMNTVKWNLQVDPNSQQVHMRPMPSSTSTLKKKKKASAAATTFKTFSTASKVESKDRELKWNSFHHIQRRSLTSTPRRNGKGSHSMSNDDDIDDMGYASHRVHSTTSKREAQLRHQHKMHKMNKMTKMNRTAPRPNRMASGRKMSSMSSMSSSRSAASKQVRETNSSHMRRRTSHTYRPEELFSRSSGTSSTHTSSTHTTPWISATRRNTVIGKHGSGISTMLTNGEGKQWGGIHTLELSPNRTRRRHKHPHSSGGGWDGCEEEEEEPGTMRPPWLGPELNLHTEEELSSHVGATHIDHSSNGSSSKGRKNEYSERSVGLNGTKNVKSESKGS
jgi:hypothetical protein